LDALTLGTSPVPRCRPHWAGIRFCGLVEVQDQADLYFGKLEISQQLSFMYPSNFLGAFKFYNDLVLNDQIHTIPTIEFDSLIAQR
jgi:hypothetical protein